LIAWISSSIRALVNAASLSHAVVALFGMAGADLAISHGSSI
jgi:hypothetical protein